MRCPIDQTPLAITQRNGVEIDYCPQCRGVWLDRGELEKILDRGLEYRSRDRDRDDDDDRSRRTYGDPRYDENYHRKRRKESWLGDLFDFD